MDDLVAAAKTMTHQLAEMTPARGLVVDSRPARPTIELEEYERRVVPLIRSMMGNYKRRAILVASQAAVLHSRRLSAGEDAIGVFLNDLDAAIAYVRG